jgi:hypothetical protein
MPYNYLYFTNQSTIVYQKIDEIKLRHIGGAVGQLETLTGANVVAPLEKILPHIIIDITPTNTILITEKSM